MYRIESDRSRFREIVRGRIREDLRKYLSTGELIGRCGDHAVSIQRLAGPRHVGARLLRLRAQ